MPFETNVFINCPFDNDYRSLLKPLLFTVVYLGFEPQISETADGGVNRFEAIRTLVRSSKYSIHDLSRIDAPRFNMPFELGIDLGAKYFGSKQHRTKRCLIIETERYRFQRVISDIAGQDIEDHRNEPERLISIIRNWFYLFARNRNMHSGNRIWLSYNDFEGHLAETLAINGFSNEDIARMTKSEYIDYCKDWYNLDQL